MFALVNIFTYALAADKAKLFGKARSIFGRQLHRQKQEASIGYEKEKQSQQAARYPGPWVQGRDPGRPSRCRAVIAIFGQIFITYAGRMRQKHYRKLGLSGTLNT